MVNMTEEMERLHDLIRTLEAQNADLRQRLDKTYEFIHNLGNSEYVQQDWDGVTSTQSFTKGNSERLDMLTRQFGIDEYPLE